MKICLNRNSLHNEKNTVQIIATWWYQVESTSTVNKYHIDWNNQNENYSQLHYYSTILFKATA